MVQHQYHGEELEGCEGPQVWFIEVVEGRVVSARYAFDNWAVSVPVVNPDEIAWLQSLVDNDETWYEGE